MVANTINDIVAAETFEQTVAMVATRLIRWIENCGNQRRTEEVVAENADGVKQAIFS